MSQPRMALLLAFLSFLALAIVVIAESVPDRKVEAEDPRLWFTPEQATAKLLMLGTFHFKDAGLDGYKPEVDVDILSEPRQAELKDVLDRLEKFAPTKILIEVKAERAEVIDERYRRYLAGEFELEANEIYQVGFRLARRLGHERLYAVDVMGRNYADLADPEAYAVEHGQAFPEASPGRSVSRSSTNTTISSRRSRPCASTCSTSIPRSACVSATVTTS